MVLLENEPVVVIVVLLVLKVRLNEPRERTPAFNATLEVTLSALFRVTVFPGLLTVSEEQVVIAAGKLVF
jgi:hypothetical protein